MPNQFNNGGPAFPVPDLSDADGMSLLDYFAGQIIAGQASKWSLPCNPCKAMEHAAQFAYDLAAAMLAERERRMR